MKRRLRIGAVAPTIVLVAAAGLLSAPRQTTIERRISFHNRLLLNRAVLAGMQRVEVLLLASDGLASSLDERTRRVVARVEEAGGRVGRVDAAIGYVRAEVAPELVLSVADDPVVAAFQISSLSLGTWYRDGPPLANATLQRSFETTPITSTPPPTDPAPLPELTHDESRAAGYTAEDDVGLVDWRRQYPTYDGRGVTIALVENGLASFTDPTLQTSLTLNGQARPKLAGILNAIDPSAEDDTRVVLDRSVTSSRAWVRVDNRTYILPRPGSYLVGTFEVSGGQHVVHRFGVAQDQQTSEVWVDTNGDGSWADERPLRDVNERVEAQTLRLITPERLEVPFVMARSDQPQAVHIYTARSSHQTMTASVAAGQVTAQSLASGVAPAARVLLVRISSPNTGGIGRILEGYLLAARHKEVDVISSSTPVAPVPDTAADFVGQFFSRLQTAYGKPILNAAGNTGLTLGQIQGMGDALSIGGLQGPRTFAALYGGGSLRTTLVHVMSATGPALDGAIKPDLLAPMERIAADLPWNSSLAAVPMHAPARRMPGGYAISCCTSASSPYAAGVVALLISAARQEALVYSADGLITALRLSARLLPGFLAHRQGNGVIDIAAAWRALHSAIDPPHIVATARIVHPLTQYAAQPEWGQGLLEFGGWAAGSNGDRHIRLRRLTGPSQPVEFRTAWTADDGTFSTPATVRLPLGPAVAVPVRVAPRHTGAHSGLLTLHELESGRPVFRTQATIVATERFDADGKIEISGHAALMEAYAHYIEVPPDTGALEFELQVTRGVVSTSLLQAHGLFPSYYLHVHPMDLFTVGPGRYRVMMPAPEPGTWTVRVKNASAMFPPGFRFGPMETTEAAYTLRIRRLAATLDAVTPAADTMAFAVINRGSRLVEPVVQSSSGLGRTHRQPFRTDGLSNLIEIDVPRETTTLFLRLSAAIDSDLFLYDCTSGECFSYDIAFPAAATQQLLVRKPQPGRWVAAISAGGRRGFPASFTVDEVMTRGEAIRAPLAEVQPRRTGRGTITASHSPTNRAGYRPVQFLELLDLSAERGEAEHPWSRASNYVPQRDRPVAIAIRVQVR